MHFTFMFSCVFDSFYGFMCNGFTVQACHHSFHFGTHLSLVILLSPVQPLTLSVTVYHTLSRLKAMFHSLEVLRTEQLCDSLNVRPFFQDGARSYSTTNINIPTFWLFCFNKVKLLLLHRYILTWHFFWSHKIELTLKCMSRHVDLHLWNN